MPGLVRARLSRWWGLGDPIPAESREALRRRWFEQMAFLRRVRGPRAHAQLIGGEVSLLDPQTHAATLEVMRASTAVSR